MWAQELPPYERKIGECKKSQGPFLELRMVEISNAYRLMQTNSDKTANKSSVHSTHLHRSQRKRSFLCLVPVLSK